MLLSLFVGISTGFLVCIPPGPINVSIVRETALGRIRAALLLATGGAAADAMISLGVALGVTWLLGGVLANTWVRIGFAVFLIVYGVAVIASERLRKAEGVGEARPSTVHGPIAVGLLQGLANPALLVNWGLVVAFLVAHHLLAKGTRETAAFSAGVGAGGFLWYALLVGAMHRLRDHAVGRWLRESVVFAGVLLVAMGVYFTARTLMAAP